MTDHPGQPYRPTIVQRTPAEVAAFETKEARVRLRKEAFEWAKNRIKETIDHGETKVWVGRDPHVHEALKREGYRIDMWNNARWGKKSDGKWWKFWV